MSTPNPQPGNVPATSIAPGAPPPPKAAPQRRQILIVSHSNLFYWWPVWALGFLLTVVSWWGERMAVVPHGTTAKHRVVVPVKDDKTGKEHDEARHVLILPKDAAEPGDPTLHISSSKNVGVIFVAVLLLVIFITNIPLRGLWSFVAILFIIFFTIIFAVMDWWATVFTWLSFLDIRINMAGYFVISVVLFLLWILVFCFFDRQMYMVVEPGQLRVCQAIGDGETSYDTTGMTTMKQRSDLFRHWVLGLGSGDLVVKTSGAHPTEIHMNNVLFVGRKHEEIEEMLRSREVVAGDNAGS